ncbi:low choriolytic enzyme-like isoform X2 [Nelusetta ayraudi]|uniref:low choriolytic enzyme-like isoform X2 n=1 Tax=Nelusetta ayraudi TaxID=303726 RepID=UPI003F706EBC
MILQAAILSLLFSSICCFTIQAPPEKTEDPSGNTIEDDKFSVSTLIEKANRNVARRERERILQALRSFSPVTCIRFTPLNGQSDFLNIQPMSGCFSFVGRRGRGQTVSLSRPGCVFRQVIQHELLHALGFNHEQTRSDRDQHVQILLQNVMEGLEYNFRTINTVNLGTPYDYNSVMHYGRYAFSKNGQPTILPIPNPNVSIGRANQMNPTDIRRVNILYRCRNVTSHPTNV